MAAGSLAPIIVCALALAACTAKSTTVTAQLPSATPSPDTIAEVTFERRCFGCPEEARVVLTREGAASRTTFGTARSGTSDRTASSTIPPSVFLDLAQAIAAEGFFGLLAEYRDPTVADGGWTSITVRSAAGEKSVLNRNQAAPAAVQRLESRLDLVISQLAWKDAIR